MNRVTAVVKNFLRNEKTINCIDSLLSTYKGIKVIVIDDGPKEYQEKILDYYRKIEGLGHKVILTDFDIGLSQGRNLALENIETEYALIGDNDFVYDEKSGVDKMLSVMNDRRDIDILCGGVFENEKERHYEGFMEIRTDNAGAKYLGYTPLDYKNCRWEDVGGSQVTKIDLGFNYFLMKSSIYPKMSWPKDIKVAFEHSTSFYLARQKGVNIYYIKNCFVLHDKTPFPEAQKYYQFRSRRSDWFKHKNLLGIEYAIDFNGNRGDEKTYNLVDDLEELHK